MDLRARLRATRVERRASAIADPAEKLRYLRGEAGRPARRRPWRAIGALICLSGAASLALVARAGKAAAPLPGPAPQPARALAAPAPVWLVERNDGTEFYSNGLRVEGGWDTSTQPRSYAALRLHDGGWIGRTDPAGIVFHTTESRLAPFDADHNHALKATGRDLLAYVRDGALYHFMIDRFGRVFRVVAESDYANHAGHSIWADAEFAYLELNHPFLAVSFEGRSGAAESAANRAQTASARLLVEMLRAKYAIRSGNCVTHAQVSVSPANGQIGYHTDWAAHFPYDEVGLPNGYESPSPAISLFGFTYAQDFIEALGGRPWKGLVAAEQRLVAEAAAAGTTTERHRRLLRQRYRIAKMAGRTPR